VARLGSASCSSDNGEPICFIAMGIMSAELEFGLAAVLLGSLVKCRGWSLGYYDCFEGADFETPAQHIYCQWVGGVSRGPSGNGDNRDDIFDHLGCSKTYGH